MIYDCFIFFNELELLELRLNELAGGVDKFVLVEATRTFTNQPKPLYYQENRARFAAFADKIIHVVVADSPDISNAWAVERFQRNCIARGLVNCRPDDIVLVSDLDEIPRATVVQKIGDLMPYHDGFFANAIHGMLNSKLARNIFQRKGIRRQVRKRHPFVWKLEQTTYLYNLNCRTADFSYGTRALRRRDFSSAEEIRYSGYKIIKDGGWHFSWMGGVERMRQKIAAYSHQENNNPQFNNPEHLASLIDGDNTRNTLVPLNDSFPRYLLAHPDKYASWIKPVA